MRVQCSIVDHRTSEKLEEYAQLLVEKRRHKGMTHESAWDLLMDGNFFGGRASRSFTCTDSLKQELLLNI